MSLFNRRWFLIGFLLLTACGFEPIYGVDKPANKIMGKIDVEVANGRNAFELRDRLIDRLGVLESDPNYLLKYTSSIKSKNLTISKDNDVTRYTLQGETNFDLVDLASKKVFIQTLLFQILPIVQLLALTQLLLLKEMLM